MYYSVTLFFQFDLPLDQRSIYAARQHNIIPSYSEIQHKIEHNVRNLSLAIRPTFTTMKCRAGLPDYFHSFRL